MRKNRFKKTKEEREEWLKNKLFIQLPDDFSENFIATTQKIWDKAKEESQSEKITDKIILTTEGEKLITADKIRIKNKDYMSGKKSYFEKAIIRILPHLNNGTMIENSSEIFHTYPYVDYSKATELLREFPDKEVMEIIYRIVRLGEIVKDYERGIKRNKEDLEIERNYVWNNEEELNTIISIRSKKILECEALMGFYFNEMVRRIKL